jgi:hypothetical protein
MPRKQIEIPPAAAKAFMRDLTAFFKETDPHKRDLIAGDQMRALWEHQRPGDRRVNILDVKELFHAMRNHHDSLDLRRQQQAGWTQRSSQGVCQRGGCDRLVCQARSRA